MTQIFGYAFGWIGYRLFGIYRQKMTNRQDQVGLQDIAGDR